MAREVRFATGFRHRPPVFDPRAPDVQVRLRGSDRRTSHDEPLRAARGILTSVLLGLAFWTLALWWWLSAR
jgi:hypothetical protein